MNTLVAYTILNILWFSVFVAGIFYLHWSPWMLAWPVLIHFTMEDLKGKDNGELL